MKIVVQDGKKEIEIESFSLLEEEGLFMLTLPRKITVGELDNICRSKNALKTIVIKQDNDIEVAILRDYSILKSLVLNVEEDRIYLNLAKADKMDIMRQELDEVQEALCEVYELLGVF